MADWFYRIYSSEHYPRSGNTYDLGWGSGRWRTLYLYSGINYSSDEKLKKEIKEIKKDTISLLDFFKIYSYKLKEDDRNQPQVGILANELETHNLFNLFGEKDEDGNLSIDYNKLTLLLIGELLDRIEKLECK